MLPPSKPHDAVYDLIGLGFGPANLAIAGALTERWHFAHGTSSTSSIDNALFIEKHDKFRWHPGMLLPDARMQISFMKDLATLRSPQSPITFLSYLHSQNRLAAFINRGSTIPSRKEYADYLSWAAQVVQDNGVDVMYGHEVIELNKGLAGTINVRTRNVITGEEQVLRARDLVISPGGAPRIPESLGSVSGHPFVIHSSAYATSIGAIFDTLSKKERPLRVAVIGSGQSAAEVTLDLRERLSMIQSADSGHEIDMVIRKGSLKPSDDSPFANEIFDPSSTDAWFNIPSERLRDSKFSEYRSTNYGVVNPRTLEVLHEVIYGQKLDDGIAKRTNSFPLLRPHINIRPYSSIISSGMLQSDHGNPSFTIVIQNITSRTVCELNYDVIICATGYQRSSWMDILKTSDIGKYFGLHAGSSTVHLLPSSRRSFKSPSSDMAFDINSPELSSESSSPSSLSTCSTPPTSPSSHIFSSTHMDSQIPDNVYISRNYRLLPALSGTEGKQETFKSRIYLQGVEEATHGLSDTLLSVLGVRAGEVVEDLYNRDD